MSSPASEVHHAQHDWADDRSLATITVLEVADATDTRVEELPPLYNAIAPDALELVLDHGSTGTAATPTTVRFEYFDQVVTVDSEGDITIRGVRQ